MIATKHLISIIDILNSNEELTEEFINEKFGDLDNYIHIIWSMILHTRTKKRHKTVDFDVIIELTPEISATYKPTQSDVYNIQIGGTL